jgi:HEAT repeat protein
MPADPSYALKPLAKLRAVEARPEMERFLDHEQDWVRHDAKRALAKLGA